MNQEARPLPPTRSPLGAREFSMEDQRRFCRLSGDANPIHMDPLVARRTIGGQCVVHGVHGLMWALEALLSNVPEKPTRLRARFTKPIYLDEKVECHWDAQARQLSVTHAGAVLTSAKLEFGEVVPAADWKLPQAGAMLRPRNPNFAEVADLPPQPLVFRGEGALASALFPSLSAALGPSRVAELAHLSSVVGMEVPGLNSLFLSMRADFGSPDDDRAEFKVVSIDERFGTVKLAVRGPGLSADIDALYRSQPVDGVDMATLAQRVTPNEFAGVNALVVGGSRGLGQATAKLIACGGGRVTITYSLGADEARRVSSEIVAHGGQCEAVQLTVPTGNLDALDLSAFDQIYYFPTPKIFGKRSTSYDADLAQKFADVYVTGFRELMMRVVRVGGRARVLYPSTIAIDEPMAELAEYIDAKLQGELLCARLAEAHAIRIDRPRIPRVETDQTMSLVKVPASTPEDVMLPLIRHLAAPVASGGGPSS